MASHRRQPLSQPQPHVAGRAPLILYYSLTYRRPMKRAVLTSLSRSTKTVGLVAQLPWHLSAAAAACLWRLRSFCPLPRYVSN